MTAATPEPRSCGPPDLAGLPTSYIETAGFDPLRDEGEEFALRLRAAGVEVTLRRHPGLVYGFANQTEIRRAAREAMLEAAEALGRTLGPPAPAVSVAPRLTDATAAQDKSCP